MKKRSFYTKSIFADGEKEADSVVKESLTTQIEGTREVPRSVSLHVKYGASGRSALGRLRICRAERTS